MSGKGRKKKPKLNLEGKSDEEIIALAQKTRAALVAAARRDFDAFVRYVIKDEQTGARLKQAWFHSLWARLQKKHKRLVILSSVELGKTSQLSVALSLFRLGQNPRARIAIISSTATQAQKIMSSIKTYIENSKELREVFPNLKPGTKWSENAIIVEREGAIKDPSCAAYGVLGRITGARLDYIVVDDCHAEENVNTQEQRDKVYKWFYSTPMSRLVDGGSVVIVGNAWHPDDMLHRLSKEGWTNYKFPVVITEELAEAFPEEELEVGGSVWPERWPMKRIDALRYGDESQPPIPPIEFARAYQCVARDDHDARFKQKWMDRAKRRGELSGFTGFSTSIRDVLLEEYSEREISTQVDELFQEMLLDVGGDGIRVYTGVDVSTGEANDKSVLFTVLVYPNGDRRLLNIESGRWQIDEILARIMGCYQRFGGMFAVENVGTQQWLAQLLQKYTAIPMIPITTGRSKADPVFGVESLAAEFANGKWIIPSQNTYAPDEAEAWIEEMLYYNPANHTGDRLMAAWFAATIARRFERGSVKKHVSLQVLG